MKIFQIGFNKCGTTSIAKYFEVRGLNVAHYEDGRLAKTIIQNLNEGLPILEGIAEFDVYSDMVFIDNEIHIEAFKEYEAINEQVPGAKFILNIRDKDVWVESCVKHPRFVERMMRVHGYQTEGEVRAHWETDWERHLADVIAALPSERLLIFDLDNDPMSHLGRFAGLELVKHRQDTLRHNYTPGKLYRWFGRNMPKPLRSLVPSKLKKSLRYALRRRS